MVTNLAEGADSIFVRTVMLLRSIFRNTDNGTTRLAGILILAVIGMGIFMGYGTRSAQVHANVIDTYYDVYVESNPDGAYNYWLEAHDAYGKPLPKLFLHFCTDFEPEFSPGQNLSILNVEHKFGCVSVAKTSPGYRLKRTPEGEPIYGKQKEKR